MGQSASLLDTGRTLRDRLLADARFHRLAGRLPLLRHVARRRANALFDLCAGFVYSQILYACVRLGLFARLKDGPQPVATLATALGVNPAALERLLGAAAALDLVAFAGADCRLGAAGATILGVAGLEEMVAHHALLYADLADPLALLREPAPSTRLEAFWAYARGERPGALADAEVAGYTALMAATQAGVAEEVLDAWDLSRHRVLLDVGGGDGAFAVRAAARAPGLEVWCFDLPPVAARAQARIARAGLAGRVRAVGGDFLADPLPRGADAASLVRVLHDHDDAAALTILRAVRAALEDGATLIVAEPLAGGEGLRVADAYFGMYLLAMRSGRPRTVGELAGLLARAGFEAPRACRTRIPAQLRVLVARCRAAA